MARSVATRLGQIVLKLPACVASLPIKASHELAKL